MQEFLLPYTFALYEPYKYSMKFNNFFRRWKYRMAKGGKMAGNAGQAAWSKMPSRAQSEEFARKTKTAIDNTFQNLNKEAYETRDMARSFFRLLESKLDMKNRKEPPTEEEVKKAIEQLKDVGRISVFASISILPGGGFSLIGLEVLARKYGIKNFTLIPSSFRKKHKRKDGGSSLQVIEEN